jgi:hypothetical protein
MTSWRVAEMVFVPLFCSNLEIRCEQGKKKKRSKKVIYTVYRGRNTGRRMKGWGRRRRVQSTLQP